MLRSLILPVAAAAGIFVILYPLPAGVMDVLLAANITFAAVILLTTIYVSSPLEFSVFPSLLLGATLSRLVLNIATTRLILTAGADGCGVEAAQLAAGRVIWAFSDFVTSGSLVVGVILFAIIVTVQFIVITRGASRISEVAARFVLDAMPGKQAAIDADLAANLTTQDEARRRRREVAAEADFYGAMDGASKFLRGDAVASVVITIVNILGGLYVGLVQYGWNWSQTVELFTRLTVGDGLVTQVPAVIVSVSAALIVTRSTVRTNLGEEVIRQIAGRPIVLVITAVFLGALMLTALPKLPLLLLGGGCASLAWVLSRRRHDQPAAHPPKPASTEETDRDVEHLLTVEPMQLEMGYALVHMVDPEQDGDLLEQIGALRREIAADLGLRVPSISIRDNMRIAPRRYSVSIRGGKVASGQLFPGQLLAVAVDTPAGKLVGRETTDPASGRPAVWISPTQGDRARMMGYEVFMPPSLLVRHLGHVIHRHAAELLTRQQVVRMLDNLRQRASSLVEEVTRKLNVGQVQRVLQNLLRERVAIRDLEGILEALSEQIDQTGRTDRIDVLSECVRSRLARTLMQRYCAEDGKLWCVRLESSLEDAIRLHVAGGDDGAPAKVPADLVSRVSAFVTDGLVRLRRAGRRPVVLCTPQVRATVHELLQSAQPEAAVLATNEVDSVEIQSVIQAGRET